ncbi:alpha/beta fold hydrolase [Amycolatopsis anabasis]|uniref:alpha/beta fold hydrolase n=1 Tax=Amycolatopsis anabasis TaxID=1840409 RepID=UPI00131C1742|nr:alpha/beta hydrolase [Amycolatopsis anabasis]
MDYALLHGTTQSPEGWAPLAEVLTGRGHRVGLVDFPVDQPGLSISDYAEIAAEQVGDRLVDPVVVAHSASGLLLPAVASALRASRLVWLAAYVPDPVDGRSLAEEIRTSQAEMFNPEWTSLPRSPTEDPAIAAYFLFHDGDLDALRRGLASLRKFYPAAAYTEAPALVPAVAPSTFVLPRHDRTLRPDWMRRSATERLGVEPIEIDGGHCPHVANPLTVANAIAF